jgi:hypothetical protein
MEPTFTYSRLAILTILYNRIGQVTITVFAEKAMYDKMVSLVERMLALHKSLKSTHNPQEADRLTHEVESVDKSIDGLVASRQLYGLSEEEIKIVEGA